MRGLLKNNFYAAYAGAKTFSVFMLLLGAFVTVVVSPPLLLFYMLLGIIGFPAIAAAGTGRDYVSKWGKYKLTLPVRRADIVKSCFISQLLWMVVGMGFAGAVMGLSWLLHGCPFDRHIDALLLFFIGSSISLFAGAFFFPLFYAGGEERSGVFLGISLLCGIGIVMGLTTLINRICGPEMAAWQLVLAAVCMFVCAFAAFAVSCPLTVIVFRTIAYSRGA